MDKKTLEQTETQAQEQTQKEILSADDILKNVMVEWAVGNPGTLNFLMLLFKASNLGNAMIIVPKLERLKEIRGTNLYILWADLCRQDMNNVRKLCRDCPDDILIDACSRQDYSGRELVAKYLN